MDYSFPGDERNSTKRFFIIAAIIVVAAIIVFVTCSGSADSEDDTDDNSSSEKGAVENADVAAPVKNYSTEEVTEALKSLPASSDVIKLIEDAQAAEAADNLGAARELYEKALESPDCGEARALVESRLGDVFIKLIFSQREMKEKIDYSVKSGESLTVIAQRNDTTVDLISKSNGISNPNKIDPGDRLRILSNAKFEITVSKSRNDLLVKMNGKFFKRYIVGTGKYGKTPVGTFRITSEKEEEPAWWVDGKKIPYGDKENILGTRWMEIQATGSTPPAKGYGIHGTWDNSSLGSQSSAGCIRMKNEDVEELFIYIPVGTPVTIVE